MEEKYLNETRSLINFISRSPSCFHAVDNIKRALVKNGFTELKESGEWEIQNGGKYFVTRNLSSIISFVIPNDDFSGIMICASHSDSPSFKIKTNPRIEAEGCYTKLNIEKYGGMAMSSWLDRPLSIAGRVIVDTGNGAQVRLVNIDRDLCVIPSLAVHMKNAQDKDGSLDPQLDMLPLIGGADINEGFARLIADAAGTEPEKIIGSDLFLYNREKGTVWGVNDEFFSSPRIDDLQCVYASVKAFLEAENSKSIIMNAVFDNEEVGSGTKQGAKSTFLSDTLERITESLGKTPSQLKRALASGMMLSADNGHAVHPNKPVKADPTNRPKPNGGVVIKYNANQRYTTDGVSEAILRKILRKNNIPYQEYVNRSDIPGGSTLGNLSNERVSLNTADIGAAQLAMHSCYESGGSADTFILINTMRAFFSSSIERIEDGDYRLNIN